MVQALLKIRLRLLGDMTEAEGDGRACETDLTAVVAVLLQIVDLREMTSTALSRGSDAARDKSNQIGPTMAHRTTVSNGFKPDSD